MADAIASTETEGKDTAEVCDDSAHRVLDNFNIQESIVTVPDDACPKPSNSISTEGSVDLPLKIASIPAAEIPETAQFTEFCDNVTPIEPEITDTDSLKIDTNEICKTDISLSDHVDTHEPENLTSNNQEMDHSSNETNEIEKSAFNNFKPKTQQASSIQFVDTTSHDTSAKGPLVSFDTINKETSEAEVSNPDVPFSVVDRVETIATNLSPQKKDLTDVMDSQSEISNLQSINYDAVENQPTSSEFKTTPEVQTSPKNSEKHEIVEKFVEVVQDSAITSNTVSNSLCTETLDDISGETSDELPEKTINEVSDVISNIVQQRNLQNPTSNECSPVNIAIDVNASECEELSDVINTATISSECNSETIPNVSIKLEYQDSVVNHNFEDTASMNTADSAFIKSEIPEDGEMMDCEITNGELNKQMNGRIERVEGNVVEEPNEERTVTMLDVLQQQQELEEDADAVLGASDDKNCTYNEGYIKRQALYACLTCCSEARNNPAKRAGVCLACSLSCHENHELIELYTKRNFRCDCGNPNFDNNPCNFTKDKTEFNTENKYNQNFSGLYCICHRPYPDLELTIEDEMIQCIMCEDWLHASHLESSVPDNDQYSEMICKACMNKNEFLHDYTCYAVNFTGNELVDVENISNNDNASISTTEPKDTNEQKNEQNISQKIDIMERSCKDADVNMDASNSNCMISMSNNESKIDSENETPKDATLNAGKILNFNIEETDGSTETNSKDNSQVLITGEAKKGKNADTSENIMKLVSENEESKSQGVGSDIPDERIESLSQNTSEANESSVSTENTETSHISEVFVGKLPVESSINPDTPCETEHENATVSGNKDIEERSNGIKTPLEILETQSMECNEVKIQFIDDKFIEKHASNNLSTETETSKGINEIPEQSFTNITKEPLALSDQSSKTVELISSENQETDIAMTEVSSKIISVEASKQTTESDNETKITDMEHTESDISQEVTEPAITNQDMVTDSEFTSAVSKETFGCTDVEMQEIVTDEETPNMDTCKSVSLVSISDAQEKSVDILRVGMESDREVSINIEKNITENTANDLVEAFTNKRKISACLEYLETNSIKKSKTNEINENVDSVDTTSEPVINTELNEIDNENTDTEERRKNKNEAYTDLNNSEDVADKVKNTSKDCKRPKTPSKSIKGAVFWPCNWRQKLCSCSNCVSMYKNNDVLFLLDFEDTVTAYEDLGKTKNQGKTSQYEKGLEALSSLDRIQQINALTEYNRMKNELLSYLISFKNRQEVVKVEDIEKFFSDIKPKKKSDGVYFCR